MNKPQPATYYDQPTAPDADYSPLQGGCPPQEGYPPQSGYPQHSVYPPQSNYPAPGGHLGYPSQSGYPQQAGYPPQSAYSPQYEAKSEHHPPSAPQPTDVAPLAPYVPKKYHWCDDTHRNRPQSHSLTAATLIFISGGMSLAWSVGFSPIYSYLSKGPRTHLLICWFIAVVIGACLATIIIQKLTKRTINFIASGLVIVNGILYITYSYSVTAIVIARYCDGIAFGLTLIPAIVAGSEESVKRFRGLVLSVEQIGLITGIIVKVVCKKFWNDNWAINLNQIHGILALSYGIVALICNFIFTIESPVFYLRKDNEADAINCLRRLQKPRIVTDETYALLNENKKLLEEDISRGRAVNISTGLMPMVKLCLFRAFVSMSFSLPLTWAIVLTSFRTNQNAGVWSPCVYALMRFIGAFIAMLTLDTVGRKGLSVFSLLVGGGLMIRVASLFSSYWNLLNLDKMQSVMRLLMAYQVFAGLAAPASTCYLGEAFSVSVKPYFILFVVTIENLVQIIISCTFYGTVESMSTYGYAVGSLQIAFAIFFFIMMPETKNTTLREALAKSKKTVNVGAKNLVEYISCLYV